MKTCRIAGVRRQTSPSAIHSIIRIPKTRIITSITILMTTIMILCCSNRGGGVARDRHIPRLLERTATRRIPNTARSRGSSSWQQRYFVAEAFNHYHRRCHHGHVAHRYQTKLTLPSLSSSTSSSVLFSTTATRSEAATSSSSSVSSTIERKPPPQQPKDTAAQNSMMDGPFLNLHTISQPELETWIVSWGYPKFRAKQIYDWIRKKGITNPHEMNNIPKNIRRTLLDFTTTPSPTQSNPEDATDEESSSSSFETMGGGSLRLEFESISPKDGTRKRAYKLRDGQLIESVLMGPYKDGRYTACISSQAGCAMGCIFCATGQMGFARQLSSDEIFEQVSRFASELLKSKNDDDANTKNKDEDTNDFEFVSAGGAKYNRNNNSNNKKQKAQKTKRLSNIVFMGMGEPLANYKNVVTAIQRINTELGIGSRKITVSTVGVVPNIRKLYAPDTDMPQIRLAVSLHCATDVERSKLLPANDRYGGLPELMTCLKEYIDVTGRRITFEWALIENENDDVKTARTLGTLITKDYKMRPDMVHINVIPLNPTSGYANGKPTGSHNVNLFCKTLEKEFRISATPRVRRGIDIDAGCGQLTTNIKKKDDQMKRKLQQQEEQEHHAQQQLPPPSLELMDFVDAIPPQTTPPSLPSLIGVYDNDDNFYDDDDDDDDNDGHNKHDDAAGTNNAVIVDFTLDTAVVDFEDEENFINPEYEENSSEMDEVHRLMTLVEQGAFSPISATRQPSLPSSHASFSSPDEDEIIGGGTATTTPTMTTTIVDEDAVRVAKKKRKKLLRNLKQIQKLKDMKATGTIQHYNQEQLIKVSQEQQWMSDVESLEHNLQ